MPTNINFDKKLGFINGTSIVLPSGPGADFSTKSLSFDGIDEYMSTGSTYSELDGQTKATFSLWVKPQLNQYGILFHIPRNTTSAQGQVLCFLDLDYRVRWSMDTTSYYGNSLINVITLNAWNHILICIDLTQSASQDRSRVFINGVNQTAVSNLSTRTQFGTSTGSLLIGEEKLGYLTPFLGNMDEFAIWAGQDLRNDVATIWNNGKPADLTSLNPTTWYRAGENSTFAYPQILMPEDTNKDKVSKYSLAFDGVGDYIDLGNPTELQITDVLSISFWFKSSSTSDQAVISKDTLGQRCFAIWNNEYGTGQNLQFIIYNSNSATSVISSTNLNDGNWHNIVCVFNPSTYLRIYVDGILDAENTTSIPTSIDNDTANFLIGGIISSGSPVYMFEGNVDEVAIWSDDLSASANAIYNGGIPTDIASLYPTRLEGYWKLGEEAKFTDNWLVPNSALSNFSKYSFNFDGIDDYIDCGLNANLSFGDSVNDSPFTFSMWVKVDDLSTGHILIERGDFSTTNNREQVFFIGSDGAIYNQIYSDGQSLNRRGRKTSTGIISINTWYHIVWTYDGQGGTNASNGIKIYLDGVRVDNANYQKNTYVAMKNTNTSFKIGEFINGNMDEVAVFNSELSASDVTAIYNGGKPKDLSGFSPISWWRMGEEATYDGTLNQFTIPDQGSGGNNGTSSNTMLLETLVGDTPQYYGGGISDSMDIFDRVGDAPNSENNTVSFNMEEADIVEDTP